MSEQDPIDTVTEVRKSLGATLRTAREDKKFSTHEIASRLMLGEQIVLGLESGEYGGLPETTFVRGYLVAYLRLLELPSSVLDDFDRINSEQFPVKLSLSAARSSCSEDGWVRCISVGLVVLLVVAVGLWLAEQTLHIFESEGFLAIEERLESKQELVVSEPEKTPVNLEVVDADSEPVIQEQEESLAPVAVDQRTPADSTTETQGPASDSVSAETAKSILMRFNAESWVEIRNAKGDKLTSKLYSKGEELVLDDDNPPFSVVVGNFVHVYIEYQGEQVNLSGEHGQVARLSLGGAR